MFNYIERITVTENCIVTISWDSVCQGLLSGHVVVSLKTNEITAVLSISNNSVVVSPYPDPFPAEKGFMRSFSLDLDAKEPFVDDPALP